MTGLYPLNIGFFLIIFIHLYVIFRPSEFFFLNTYYPIYIAAIYAFIYKYKYVLGVFLRKEIIILFFLAASFFLISITNSNHAGFYDKRLLLTWAAWLLIVMSIMASIRKPNNVLSLLENIAKLILIVQLLISSVQLFYPDFFSQIWTSVETRGLDSYVRITGSMVNPIAFSFFISYLVLVIIAIKGPLRNLVWVLMGLLLVVLSGTRSLMLVYPFLIAGWFYLESDCLLLKRLCNAVIFALFLFFLMFVFIYLFRDVLKYSAELLSLIGVNSYSDNDLYKHEELRTFGYRVVSWNAALIDFFSRDLFSMVFGHSGPYLSPAHHDLLYMLTRYGILGLMLYLFLNLYLLALAYKNRDKAEGRLMYLSVLLIFVVGMANTVGVEMKMGILSAMTAGLFFSSVEKKKESGRE